MGAESEFLRIEMEVSVRNIAFRRTTSGVVSMSELFGAFFVSICCGMHPKVLTDRELSAER